MKKSIYIGLIIVLIALSKNTTAQIFNWNRLENTKHLLHAQMGLDHAVSYGLGYGYQLNTQLPIVLNAAFSLPVGKNPFDDFKTKIGGHIQLLTFSNFSASIALFGIYRRHQSPYIRLQNLGSEIKGSFGYYKSKWFTAVEAGFDHASMTHFKHSQLYKNNIYAEVVDGWYGHATGGNFYYGLQGGYSFKKIDITLQIGRTISQDFKTLPFLPFYLNLGLNYSIHKQ